ncbi:MAG: clostripain-related cysteine peptidase, partial [Chloroflexi bacterium]|nr:clostripain-related cysteine peptidase [Chloroflexota bacterium]
LCKPLNYPYLPVPCEHFTDVTFTSTLVSGETRQQAVAAWYDIVSSASTACAGVIPLLWPQAAVWDGDSWGAMTEIPGRPAMTILGNYQKLGLSADQHGNVRLTFPDFYDADFCAPPSAAPQVRTTNWSNASQSWSTATLLDTGVNLDLAVLEDNTAVGVYSGLPDLKWASAAAGGSWTIEGTVAAGAGYTLPSVAAVHAAGLDPARAVAVWSDGGNLKFAERLGGGGWSSPGDIGAGSGAAELAAHTGSPSLPQAEWTVGVYSAGEHTHWESTIYQSLVANGSTALVNAVSQIDSDAALFAGDPDPHSSRIFYHKVATSTLRLNLGDANMGQPDTLRDFGAWLVEHYPAGRYLLSPEDHGDAWRSICYDETHPGEDRLTLPEIRTGLDGAGFTRDGVFAGRRVLNLLAFVTCTTATVEMAYEVQELANFMVASEDWMDDPTAGGGGVRYDHVVAAMIADPHQGDEELAGLIVQTFAADNDNQTTLDHTLSAVDLGQVGAPGAAGTLMQRISQLAAAINAAVAAEGEDGGPAGTCNDNVDNGGLDGLIDGEDPDCPQTMAIHNAAANAEVMQGDSGQRDLQSFAQQLQAAFPAGNAIHTAAGNVITALGNAVVANWADNVHRVGNANGGALQVHGLTIWLEQDQAVYDDGTPGSNHDQYDLTRFEIDLAGAGSSWSQVVDNVAQPATGALLLLEMDNPDLFMEVTLPGGQSAGGLGITGKHCEGVCASDIPGASCSHSGLSQEIWVPETPAGYGNPDGPSSPENLYFTWTIDGSLLATTVTFTLTIQTIEAGVVIDESVQSGTVAPGQTISGTFGSPLLYIYLPVVLRMEP